MRASHALSLILRLKHFCRQQQPLLLPSRGSCCPCSSSSKAQQGPARAGATAGKSTGGGKSSSGSSGSNSDGTTRCPPAQAAVHPHRPLSTRTGRGGDRKREEEGGGKEAGGGRRAEAGGRRQAEGTREEAGSRAEAAGSRAEEAGRRKPCFLLPAVLVSLTSREAC